MASDIHGYSSWISNLPIILLYSIIVFGLLYKFARNFLCRERKATAILIDKYNTKYQSVGFNPPFNTKTDYILVFQVEEKVLKFKVTNWVYTSFHENQKGLLIYKGTRFINFKTSEKPRNQRFSSKEHLLQE